jgi:hypothetical protein
MKFWKQIRPLVGVAIIAGVGWHFSRLLARPEFQQTQLAWRWPSATGAAALYLAAITFWGMFFARLVRRIEPGPSGPILSAYLISHVGKYVPGRALALVLRIALAYPRGVPVSVSVVATVYETLVSMACGAVLAAGILVFVDERAAWRSSLLFLAAGLPVLPGVFDRIVMRVARRFLPAGHAPLPRTGLPTLVEGMGWGAAGWICLGLSLLALMHAILPEPPATTPPLVAALIGAYAISHVGGFIALPAPGGIGVREAILQKMLVLLPVSTMIDDGTAVAIALAFRCVHVGADFAIAAVLYPLEMISRSTR